MTENTRKKSDWNFVTTVGAVLLVLLAISYGARWVGISNEQRWKERKETACPSLLSIGRSARDTLIIMKNEPLCNQYVLDNLK